MLKTWHNLKKKFHVGGSINQTTKWAELIAALLFWWLYSSYIHKEDYAIHKSFIAFFDIEK